MTSGPRLLRRGTEGADVRALQIRLNLNTRSHLLADGVFEVNTEDAVKRLQRSNRLPATGIVCEDTRKALSW